MARDRFDHVFVEPSRFDASLAFYRDALGWRERFAWGGEGEPRGVCLDAPGGMSIVTAEPHAAVVARDPDGNLIAFEQPPA